MAGFMKNAMSYLGMSDVVDDEDDYIEELLMTTTHHYLMFFTNTGRVYRLKAYEIPEASRTARGTAIVNLLQLQPGEKITAVIPMRKYEKGHYLFMATKKGLVKKTPLEEYENETHMVVEGALACKTIEPLARSYGVELPITKAVRSVLWDKASIEETIMTLFDRPLTTEFWGLEHEGAIYAK